VFSQASKVPAPAGPVSNAVRSLSTFFLLAANETRISDVVRLGETAESSEPVIGADEG
jgi:hypothetical protein